MSEQRASIFEDDNTTDFDVSGFAPKKQQKTEPRIPAEAIQTIAKAAKFQSREATAQAAPAPATTAAPVTPEPPRQQRRHRTGRNVQLNLKAKQETVDRFYQLTDSQGWVLGETLEQAIAALEEKLATR